VRRIVFIGIVALAASIGAAAQAGGPAAGAQPALPAAPSPGTVPSAAPAAGAPFRFVFAYGKGDKFRILSTVDESVYIDRRLAYRSEILNRIAYEIADAAPDGSSGLLRGTFETSEREKGASAYAVTGSYDSEFRRDRLGRYEIDPKYYMPVVRGDPTFPDKELLPGDTWNAPGEERHDFRAVGLSEPYAIPIDVRYRYVGPVAKDGRNVQLVTASYTIFLRPQEPRTHAGKYPVQLAGYSDQKIYWDPAGGDAIAYEESFDLVFDWSDGSNYEFRGSAQSKQLSAERMDRETMKSEIEKAVADLPNVSVAATGEGVTISIEDIQFEADSAVLKQSEAAKVARIAELLKRYPDRDILVEGHSAAAGYAAGRKLLSEQRAQAVAERIIALGARTSERVRAAGYGDERPIAGNDTEAGRARNRRVEITILEN
jgi:outer membrane protein OmpA-like peptidoglycan-associated protein